jgi:4-aminobutyrate aminotransferase-like enzyme
MLGIRLAHADVQQRLAAEHVHVEVLGSVLRVSPPLHVTDGDVKRLLAAFDEE